MRKKQTSTVAVATSDFKLKLDDYTFDSLREKVQIKKITTLPKRLKTALVMIPGKRKPVEIVIFPKFPNIKTLAAAGPVSTGVITTQDLKEKYPNYFINRPIQSLNIREMTDPYNANTRRLFTDCARTDPTLAPALRKRNNAFFRNGFVLKLRLKSHRSQVDGHILTPEEQDIEINQYMQQFLAQLNQLDSWCKEKHINLLSKIKSSHYVGTVQGRFLLKFFPPLSLLEPNKLPITAKVISAEEEGNVIIDRMTEDIVAIRIYSVDESNFSLLPDEFVYEPLNDSALTRYERFYGRSDLEPIVQLSRINKHIVNIGYAKAFEAAYLPKILAKIPVDGSPEEKTQQLEGYAAMLASASDVAAIEATEHADIQAYPQEVKHEMITAIRKDIDEIILGAAGSTKAQISRTENLTRDNATIMEIENERNVVTPDEKIYSQAFESQLLNPLFAHLVGVPAENLPVEVIIERIPDKKDPLTELDEKVVEKQEGLKKDKSQDIQSQDPTQDDAVSSFGATGNKKNKSSKKQSIPKTN